MCCGVGREGSFVHGEDKDVGEVEAYGLGEVHQGNMVWGIGGCYGEVILFCVFF